LVAIEFIVVVDVRIKEDRIPIFQLFYFACVHVEIAVRRKTY